MPEYSTFEPVDATDMVNLATGDFSYSIPVMSVPGPGLGFPLVLGYHSGILVKEEASWVGLGWNLQAGAINRQLNKYPDDFKEVLITESIKSNKIYGWFASVSYNAVTVGTSWDNTNGYGGMVGLSLSPTPQMDTKGFGASINLQAGWNGVYEGVGFSYGLGYGQGVGNIAASAGLSVGVSSREGFTAGLGTSVSIIADKGAGANKVSSLSLASAGVGLSSKGGINADAGLSVGINTTISALNHTHSFSSSAFMPYIIPGYGGGTISWGYWESWIDGVDRNLYYGFLYADKASMGCTTTAGQADCSNWNTEGQKWRDPLNPNESVNRVKHFKKHEVIEAEKKFSSDARLMATAEDLYSVAGQGLVGSFKPYRKEDGDYLTYLETVSKMHDIDCSGGAGWFFENLASLGGALDFDFCQETAHLNRTKYLEKQRNYVGETGSGIYWRFLEDMGGAEYIEPYGSRDAAATVSVQSKRVIPKFQNYRLVGFQIVKEDGVTYNFTRPVFNFIEIRQGASKESSFEIDTKQEIAKSYAYSWLLKSILSPDYLPLANSHACTHYDDGKDICEPADGDVGGWVKFNYGNGSVENRSIVQHWMSPYFRPNLASPPPNLTDAQKKAFSYTYSGIGEVERDRIPKATAVSRVEGMKEVYYLMSVETPTHKAEFQTEKRDDALGGDFSSVEIPITSDQWLAHQPVEVGTPSQTQLTNVPICELNPVSGNVVRFSVKKRYRVDVDLPVGTPLTVRTKHRKYGGFPGSGECEPYPGPFGTHHLVLDVEPLYVWNRSTSGNDWYMHQVVVQSDGTRNYFAVEIPDVPIKKVVTPNGGSPVTYMDNNALYPFDSYYKVNPAEFNTPEDHDLLALKKIVLKNKADGATVSAVAFEYDYSLAQNTPNSMGLQNGSYTHGKLTLRSLKLGGGQDGPWQAPYKFHYQDEPTANSPGMRFQPAWAPYEMNYFDRWGYACHECFITHEPYRHDAAAWSLNRIILPSDGEIKVSYEADRYDWVGYWDEAQGQRKQRFKSPFYASTPVTQLFLNEGNYRHESLSQAGRCGEAESECIIHPHANARRIQETVESYTLKINMVSQLSHQGKDLLMAFKPGTSATTFSNCILSPTLYTSLPSTQYGGMKVAPMTKDPSDYSKLSFELKVKNEEVCKDIKYAVYYVDNLSLNAGSANYYWEGLPQFTQTWTWIADLAADQAQYVGIGGGIRVKSLIFEDKFGPNAPVTNEVRYSYSGGVTPNLPPNLSDYVDALYPPHKGYEFHAGNPGVIYSKVTAEFPSQGYSTAYHFVTAKDLPMEISDPITSIGGQGFTNGANYSVTVKNFSGLWGNLWKQVDYSNGGEVVRTQLTQWAYNAEFNGDQNKVIGESPNQEILMRGHLESDGKPYVYLNSPTMKLKYPDASDNWRKYFGLHQNVASLRYFSVDCNDPDNFESCATQNVKSTQMVFQRYLPHPYRIKRMQDGLQDTSLTYHYDFLTGVPLKGAKTNSNGAVQVTASLPAYAFYDPMFKGNQLTQNYASTVYEYPSGRAEGVLQTDETSSNAISSSITKWKPYFFSSFSHATAGHVLEKHQAFRVFETSQWSSDRGAFVIPEHTCRYPLSGGVPVAGDAYQCYDGDPVHWGRWVGSGMNKVYDRMGHVVEFEDAHGNSSAQVFAWGNALPSAFAAGARSNEIFHESFESIRDIKCKLPSYNCDDAAQTPTYANYSLSKRTRKTGSQSVRVQNAGVGELCMRLPKLEKGKPYLASAWFFDATSSSESNQAQSTRPGICIGNRAPECVPVNLPVDLSIANGTKSWKRIESEFTVSYASSVDMDNLVVCLEASNGIAGADILYDEIRVKPLGSQMTSVAYNSSGQMTSSSNVNETTTYFEYDSFGNLMGIRNDDGVLLSEQGKNYGAR